MEEETLDPEKDYEIEPGETVEIGVRNLSVLVKHDDEGAVVDIYPKTEEVEGPIGSTWAAFTEGDPPEGEV